MVESKPTRQTTQALGEDPQEIELDDVVGYLRNAIQAVINAYEEQMAEIDRELYTLQKYRLRLMEDKSDPMISQAKIQKKIDEIQAEMTPLNADSEILKTVKQEFQFKIEIFCDKTKRRIETKDREPNTKFDLIKI